MKRNTERQKQIYDVIVNYTLLHGYPPTIRDILAETDLKSSSSIHYHLQSLIKEGLIETDSSEGCEARAIRLTGYRLVKESAIIEKIELEKKMMEMASKLLSTNKFTKEEVSDICDIPVEKVAQIDSMLKTVDDFYQKRQKHLENCI